ncbi:acetyltransferase [Guggenheimella bovis]
MKRVALFGGGGHARSVLGAIDKEKFTFVGVIVPSEADTNLPIFSLEKDLESHKDEADLYFIAVGSLGDTSIRVRISKKMEALGLEAATIIDPSAILSEDVEVEPGTFIGKGAIINSGAKIGRHAIINSGAIVEHDVTVGDFAHVSSGAVLAGTVTVGSHSHVGLHATVLQGLHLVEGSKIGAGSVVTKDVTIKNWLVGNPAKEIK